MNSFRVEGLGFPQKALRREAPVIILQNNGDSSSAPSVRSEPAKVILLHVLEVPLCLCCDLHKEPTILLFGPVVVTLNSFNS